MTWQAYGSIVIGSVLLALYSVFTKKTLSAGWKKREALLTTLITGTCAIMLFATCWATGGPKIKPGFWFPVLAT